LYTANHAIFLGPLFIQSWEKYKATETQAIGRVGRYGQEKKVHIHRLLALDTIDMTNFDSRRAESRSKPDHVEIPVEEYKGKKVVPRKPKGEVEVEVIQISPKKKVGSSQASMTCPTKKVDLTSPTKMGSSQEVRIEVD